MKILLLVSIVLLFPTGKVFSETIWETSILESLEKAKKEDKPIFVELYADWCKTCKKLEKTLLQDKEVLDSLKPFVLVRLNGEEYPNFMHRYNVRGFPTLLFLDKYSNFIAKLQGLPDKSLLIREAKKAHANSNTEARLLTQLKNHPQSLQAQFELGIFYYQKEDFEKSSSYFQTVQSSKPKDKSEEDLVQQASYNLALLKMNQGKYKDAIPLWDNYIQKYKDTSLSGAYLHRGIAYRELGNLTQARKDFLKAKSLSPYPEEVEIIEEELQSLSKP